MVLRLARPWFSTRAHRSSGARPSPPLARDSTSPLQEPPPIRTTGIGSWPGTDMADAVKIAFAECPDLPYLPELPARGGLRRPDRTLDRVPRRPGRRSATCRWRLTDASGRDHRLAISTLRADLDVLEEHAQGYQGTVKLSVAGPWTLAAMMERPRGDRVLADPGARRDVGQSARRGNRPARGRARSAGSPMSRC